MAANVRLKKYGMDGSIFFEDDDEDLAEHVKKVIQRHKNSLEELITHGRTYYDKAKKYLHQCQRLESLTVTLGFNSFKVLPCLKNLTTLIIEHTDEEYSYKEGTLPPNSLPKLTTLSVETYECWYSQKPLFSALADACPNLTILEIECNDRRDKKMTQTLAKIIKTCTKLERLQCVCHKKENVINIDKIQFWKLENLKFLILNGWNLTVFDCRRILRQCSNLEALQCDGMIFMKPNATMQDKKIFYHPRSRYSVFENNLEIICEIQRMC